MTLLIAAGTALSIVGLVGLLFCIYKVAKAKKDAENDEALRDSLRSVLPLNLGSLLLSAIGLITVVIGILLGP